MTDHLIEIIFKNISLGKVGALLRDLISKGQELINYDFTCDYSEIDWSNKESIDKIFFDNQNFGLFINLKALIIKNIHLPNCGIAVFKSENTIDVEINFMLSDLKSIPKEDLTELLMELGKYIAIQYQIDHYYCGLEPAEEITTRLFTNEQVGPFSF
jgi:hypothetical protein